MKKTLESSSLLIDTLSSFYPDSSRGKLRKILQAGRVTVNGEVEVRASAELTEGSEVEVHRDSQKGVGDDFPIPLLFEDSHLIAVRKPAGLLSVPLDRNKGVSRNALALVRQFHPSVYPLHRLDRETTGVLLFAKTEIARDRMNVLFREHNLVRQYHAVVEGLVEEDEGTWRSRLKETKALSVRSGKGGQLAITHYSVIKRTETRTHLRLTLETGKKHQIRVHCAEAGHPILGDKRYGDGIGPLRLHARLLSFKHPMTDEELEIVA